MREWLILATEIAVLVVDAMALVVIAFGTIEAFVSGLRVMIAGTASGFEKREVWLRYGRTLVAGLTFQLAADILESSITTDWNAVGRLAAIAVIRTFLNYFLERDLADIRERQQGSRSEEPTGAEE
ncbi:MAG TPA: DUF1622 domain-containing protein [Microvirga sp.]|jgi:uncharacterized membrane protein|nr:DUF1622 domain-containing protein [Microvirga sp.]